MITARQIRAARCFAGWSQEELADHAILAISTIRRIEQGKGNPLAATLDSIQRALEKAGVEFLPGERIGPAPSPTPAPAMPRHVRR